MPHTQEGRLISIDTPLGTDKLLLAGFTGHEAMSRLFSFHLDLLAEPEPGDPPIDFTHIVGQSVTLTVVLQDDTFRYFNGLVSQFAMTGMEGAYTRYEMQVVPKLWTLTRYANCRIFHNMSVKEIISDVFSRRGFSDYEMHLNATYPTLEYTVQYRETDFNFISRLMEKFGIFYFFDHKDGSHTMKLMDSNSSIFACPKLLHGNAEFNLATGGLDDDDVVDAWSQEWEWKSGKVAQTDYNFKTPSTNLLTEETTVYSVAGNTSFELFDFPGEYPVRGDGKQLAKTRMEEEEAGHLVVHGSSVCRAFTTGTKFNLVGHPQDAYNKSYILTEIHHIASAAGSYGLGPEGMDTYTNHFTCIPDNINFRPARLTPKPFVQGPQTAVVVGKKSNVSSDDSSGGDGEEIWVDKFGRVLVLFPWDRDGLCSCWVRVSQDWAGKAWGMINIPRVGQEVLVSFLEGDPDRPIVTGRVYNEDQVVPYELPANGTRTTFKTRSSPNGGDDNYNELRFEDKKGSEQIFLRGEKDLDVRFKNDAREWIGNDQSIMIIKDRSEDVGGNESIHIAKNRTEKVDGNEDIQIGGNQQEKISGNVSLQISGNQSEAITGDMNHAITGNFNHKSSQNVSIQAGMNMYEKSGMAYAHDAGMTIHLKAGMSMVLEAGVQLSLKAGASFIDIGPAGVSISGAPLVMINSGGAAGSGSGSSPTSPASPSSPGNPNKPDEADDGKAGVNKGAGPAAAGAGGDAGGGAGPAGASAPSAPSAPSSPSLSSPPPSLAALAGLPAVDPAQQTAQQVANQAAQTAQQAAQQAQQAANGAEQLAQQAEQQAQQEVAQVTQQASQAIQQANQAVQAAQQAVNQAVGQAKAQAQQSLNQAQQAAQQAEQQGQAAVQQAQQQAQQVQQQAQQAAQQAQQAAQQAQQQAQQAAQQAQQAAKQAQQQAQQAAQQAQQAAQQAVQQAQQAAKQAQQAGQQAQQAAKQVQQAASQSVQQAQQSAQQAQQAAQQAISQAGRGI